MSRASRAPRFSANVRHAAMILVATCLVLASLGLAQVASAAPKSFGGYLGGGNHTTQSAGQGGLYSSPGDVVVYEGVDGDSSTDKVFVVERGGPSAGNRVQRLDVDGNFERAWGKDVSASIAGAGFEICTEALDCQGGLRSSAGSGEFNQPSGVAVDQANGWVYVRDRSHFRVQKFDLDGNFLSMFGEGVNQTTGGDVCTQVSGDVCKIGVAGAGPGQFGATTLQPRLAVDQASGDVLAADPQNGRVLRFNSDGSFDSSFGTAGTGLGQFGVNQPQQVAVDSSGIVYLSDSNDGNQVQRYDLAAGVFVAPIKAVNSAPTTGPLIQTTLAVSGLAIDRDTDGAGPDEEHLLVARDPNTPTSADTVVQELDIPSPATDPVTVEIDRHVFGTPAVAGVAVNSRTGAIYLPVTLGVSTQFPACACGLAASGLVVLSHGGGTPPEYGPLSTTTVGTTTATLQGLVDPNGLGGFRIEYSADGTTWQPASPDRYVSGSDQATVTVSVGDLDPNTVYRMRMVGTKYLSLTNRATTQSAEATFLTDSAPPDVATLPIGPRTDTTAQLRATVDPNGTATTYWFEYGGDTSYGTRVPLVPAPAGAGNEPLFLVQDIAGLLPNTTYHYRVVADGSGAPVAGGDQTFTTHPTTSAPGLGDRAFELVSPADKVAGIGVGPWYGGPAAAQFAGTPAHEGERFAAQGEYGSVLIADGGQAYASDWAFADRVSDSAGWVSHSPITHAATGAQDYRWVTMPTATPDLSRVAWQSNAGGLLRPFPEMENWATIGPTFVGDWAGRWEIFGPTDPDSQLFNGSGGDYLAEIALSADGSTVVGSTSRLRGLAGPDDPTLDLPAAEFIRNLYVGNAGGVLADNMADTGARVLASVCAGQTTVPAVDGGGGLIGEPCPDGALVSQSGATLQRSAPNNPRLWTSPERVVSRDGSRIFFMSPDPLASGVPNGVSEFCDAPGETCPAQLFVRYRRDNGDVVTRWISRSRSVDFGGGRFGGGPLNQDASLLGQALFEGASEDGDKVFFRSNSPLTPDDPNGGSPVPGGVTNGSASPLSWDLFMYDLPDDPAADPAAGTLTRVSAGPTGDSDANNPQSSQTDARYAQGSLRFVSKDGSRLYFVTAAPLAGVAPPSDGTLTSPGGDASATDRSNLYLFDNTAAGAARWRFVARLPRSVSGADSDATSCATTGVNRGSILTTGPATTFSVDFADGNPSCVKGNSTGTFMTLFTSGRLTVDDPDSVSGDVYGYDAVRDELVRLTAAKGRVGGSYPCGTTGASATVRCNGEPGFDTGDSFVNRYPNPSLGVATDPADADDRMAFFQSRSRLVAQDTDAAYDVYQWRNGELSLLTPGDSPADNGQMYKGNDRTGRNVYFATMDRLSWQDFDSVLDVYTARIGGGIAPPPPPDLCAVLTGGCHGGDVATVAAQVLSKDGSSGDARRPARVRLSVAVPGVAARRRAARTGVLALRVRSSAAGRVSILARGRIGGRARRVGRGAVQLVGPGTRTVRIRLSRAARARLAAGRSLRLSLRVASPGARGQTVGVTLRRAGR